MRPEGRTQGEIRNPKARNPKETRNPKSEAAHPVSHSVRSPRDAEAHCGLSAGPMPESFAISAFGFRGFGSRISFGFRPSDFGLRISDFQVNNLLDGFRLPR